jgi:hypothetical protein
MNLQQIFRRGGFPHMASDHVELGDDFIWRQGRAVVALSREREGWQVSYIVTTRLMGPRQMLYHRIHEDPKIAAWDVMARVIEASHSEEEGVEVARDAVSWMKRYIEA